MDAVVLYLNQIGQISLADLVPFIAFACMFATAGLRILPAPTATSSPAYVAIYSVVHFAANFRLYLHEPQFSPENVTATFSRFTTMMDQFSATMTALQAPIAAPAATQPAPVPAAPSAAGGAVTGMVAIFAVLSMLGLAACSPQTDPTEPPPTAAQALGDFTKQLAEVNQVACQLDQQEQPVLVSLAVPVATMVQPGAAAPVQGGVLLDQTLLHPAVIAACANIGGVAVGAVPVPAAAAPAASAP